MSGRAMDGRHDLPEAAFAAALACLPAVGAKWLGVALERFGPRELWDKVAAGDLAATRAAYRVSPVHAGKVRDWPSWASSFDVARFWQNCQEAGISVTWPNAPGFPPRLQEVPSPVGVLFVAGNPAALDNRQCVALVGTRHPSDDGLQTAFQLGYELARAGVCVVSGLAQGIDGAAHSGAVSAIREMGTVPGQCPLTIGVAASGVDSPYPAQNAALWHEVARQGAVVSEAPPGTRAQSWRFPVRNRVIAALSQLVVVVECHLKSGTWHTVSAADDIGVDVGAVPGSVHQPSAAGSNKLLRAGAHVIRNTEDILDSLGGGRLFVPSERGNEAEHGEASAAVPGPAFPPPRNPLPLGPLEREVLSVFNGRSLALDEVVERAQLPVGAVVLTLQRLAESGQLLESAGWWSKGV